MTDLKQTEIDTLHAVAKLKFVTAAQLAKVLGRVSKVEGWENQLAHRRLRALRKSGYLEARQLPYDSRELVYYYKPVGAYRYRRAGFGDAWAPSVSSNVYLPHEVMLTDLQIVLEVALTAEGCFIVDSTRDYDDLHEKFEGGSVNPDWFFGIENPKKPEAERYSYFFVEFERSPQKYIKRETTLERKMKNYLAYAKGPFQKKWDVPTFRVLAVLLNQARQTNFIKRVVRTPLGKAKFLYHSLPSLNTDPLTWATAQDGARSLIA